MRALRLLQGWFVLLLGGDAMDMFDTAAAICAWDERFSWDGDGMLAHVIEGVDRLEMVSK